MIRAVKNAWSIVPGSNLVKGGGMLLIIAGLFILVKKLFKGSDLGNDVEKYAKEFWLSMWKPGTDAKRIIELSLTLEPATLKQVYFAFGEKRYSLVGHSAIFGTKLDLFQWFKKELKKSELDKITQAWKATGLTLPW